MNVNASINGVGEFIFNITDDITLNSGISTSSSASNALVLSAGDSFINNSGSNALSVGDSRWLIYSDNPTENTRGSLLPSASEFNKTYAGNSPNTISSGNRFLYATSARPTLNYQVDNQTIVNGDIFIGTLSYISGLLSGDTVNNIGQTGGASFRGYTNPGTITMTASTGTLFNSLGYSYNFSSGKLSVLPTGYQSLISNVEPASINNISADLFSLNINKQNNSDTNQNKDYDITEIGKKDYNGLATL